MISDKYTKSFENVPKKKYSMSPVLKTLVKSPTHLDEKLNFEVRKSEQNLLNYMRKVGSK